MLKLRAGVLLAILLLAGLLPLAATAQTPSRSMKLNQLRGYGWPTVTVNFNLRSLNNTPLGDIRPDQFVIEENGVAQQVTGVALAHDIGIPLSVVLVLDTSGSMQGPKLSAAQAAGAAFMDGLGAGNEVALLPLNTRVQPAIPFTTDKQKITDGLNSQVAAGNTLLYDALYTAAQLVNTSQQGNRRAIVLLTDGQGFGQRPPVGVRGRRRADGQRDGLHHRRGRRYQRPGHGGDERSNRRPVRQSRRPRRFAGDFRNWPANWPGSSS